MSRTSRQHNRSIIARDGQRESDSQQPTSCDPSRRQFLRMLAGAGAYAILSRDVSVAQASRTGVKPGLIDLHHHFFPPAFRAVALEKYRPRERAIVQTWTPQRALESMEENGVAIAILSITTPGIWFGDVQAARSLARECNEYAAQLVRDHPGRFGFFTTAPLPDTKGSLSEIAYALDVLKADGVGLMTNYGDTWPGEAAYSPVFDELNRRKAVDFHPTAPNCCRNLLPDVPAPLTEYPHDTTRAITSLLYSGSFARWREIRFIFSHAGGTIPMLAGRLSQLGALFDLNKNVPNGVEYELKRLYYEIANSANRAAMAALMNLVPTSHILFGTDYPFVPINVTAGGLTSLKLSDPDLQALRHGNARGLLSCFEMSHKMPT